MKARLFSTIVLLFALTTSLVGAVSAQGVELSGQSKISPESDWIAKTSAEDISLSEASELPEWRRISTEASPPSGGEYAMVYDTARRKVVLFTGFETWEYDGFDWRQVNPSSSPTGRYGFSMTYDVSRAKVVLFGGRAAGEYLNDTWEYDGTTWTQRSLTISPPARAYHAMAYDTDRNRVVLFGGIGVYESLLNDTWEYDGSTWVRRYTTNSPSGRYDHAMTYDAGRQRVILVGGIRSETYTYMGTWEYDGTNWIYANSSPYRSHGHAIAYDASRRRVVLYGGMQGIMGPYENTLEYDGVNWTSVSLATNPGGRRDHVMTYDSYRRRVVLFGGCSAYFACLPGSQYARADTWEYGVDTNDDFDAADMFPEPPPNGLANQILQTDINEATVAPDDPDMGCGAGVNSHTVWFKLTPSYYGRLRIRTYSTLDPAASSNYDTVVAVFTGRRGALQRVACNDDAPGHEPLSDLTFEATAGETYYIEVAAYDNTPGGTLSLFMNYEVSPKAWTLMFYIAANNDLAGALEEQRNSLSQAARNLDVNIVALWDDNLNLFGSKYMVFTPYGVQTISKPELNTGDAHTLKDFVNWGIDNYPANHYALIISNHGHGISGTSVDTFSENDWLTLRETSDALAGIYPKPDIIYMNACLMGNIESAYQLAYHATYYVASESLVFGSTPMDCFVIGSQACGLGDAIAPIRISTSPLELALSIAANYYLRWQDDAGTISVISLSDITDVAVKASNLAGLLRTRMSSMRSTLDGIWADVQRFDENDLRIATSDRVADLYHFAQLVQQRINDPQVSGAATELMIAIGNAVEAKESWSGPVRYRGQQVYWDHSNAYGISVFLPSPNNRACYYNGDWLDFAYGTYWQCQQTTATIGSSGVLTTPLEWGPMLVEYINLTNPSAPEELNPPVPVPMLTSFSVYLPLVLRQFGSTPPPTPTPPPSGPAIRIEPTSGLLGTRFNIYGSGFVPGESVQQWVITPSGGRFDDPTPETVDSQGNYTSWVEPGYGSPTGTYTLYARGSISQQTVSAQFQITSSAAGGTEEKTSPVIWGR